MSFLFSGYAALRGEKGQVQTAQDTIDKLTDRVANSTLAEDRRAAMLGLKGLARDCKLDVGTKSMNVLTNTLNNDRQAIEIIKPTLETLYILCSAEDQSPTAISADAPPPPDSTDLGVMFSEIFVKNPSNVAVLLDILEEGDFYVRFNAIQLLSTLLTNLGNRLHDSILTSPLGISRLMDLLDDKREIIRNDGLLLLIALTKTNAEIQKIIAFENAFDRLLGIVLSEGATDGGIIVQDCLTLTLNLLRYNVSNQNLFRESSCIQRIPSLLVTRIDEDDSAEPVPLTHELNTWSEQKIANAVLVLELVRILVGPKNPNTAVNQNIIFQASVYQPILEIALSEKVPARVKAQALYAVGESMRGRAQSQEAFAKYVNKTASKSEKLFSSALLTVIKNSLRSDEDFGVRAAAAFCFQSFIFNNPDNQLALAATLTPPPPDNPNAELSEQPQSPGSLLVTTILDWNHSKREPYRIWFASAMLAHVLSGNRQCQELALGVRFMDDDGDEPISLLHKVMFTLLQSSKEQGDSRIAVGIMALVATWLYGSAKAVKEFLSEGSNLQFLIEQINHSSGVDPLVQGLAAYLMTLCHEFNDDSEPAFTQASIQTLIVSRIGIDLFASRIERLKESRPFQKASPYLLPPDSEKETKGLPELFFDLSFVNIIRESYDSMISAVINPNKTAATKKEDEKQKALLESYKSLIATQELELDVTRKRLEELEARYSAEIAVLNGTIQDQNVALAAMEKNFNDVNEKYTDLVREQDDLLVCLAESDMTIQQLKERLRALGQEVESDVEDAPQ